MGQGNPNESNLLIWKTWGWRSTGEKWSVGVGDGMKVALYRCLKQIIYSQKNPGNDWGIGRVEWLEVLLSGLGCVWKEAVRNPVLAPGPWRPVVILLRSKDGGDALRGCHGPGACPGCRPRHLIPLPTGAFLTGPRNETLDTQMLWELVPFAFQMSLDLLNSRSLDLLDSRTLGLFSWPLDL